MQRLKELNQLSKEEAQRIQTLRYRRSINIELAVSEGMYGHNVVSVVKYNRAKK